MKPILKTLDKPCDECPFLGRIKLGRGRLKQIVRDCHTKANERNFVCHKVRIARPRVGPVMCRGFHDRYPMCSTIQQVAVRLGALQELRMDQAIDPKVNPKAKAS